MKFHEDFEYHIRIEHKLKGERTGETCGELLIPDTDTLRFRPTCAGCVLFVNFHHANKMQISVGEISAF